MADKPKSKRGGPRPNTGRKFSRVAEVQREAMFETPREFLIKGSRKHVTMSGVQLAAFILLEGCCGRATTRQILSADKVLDRLWGKAPTNIHVTGGLKLGLVPRLNEMRRNMIAASTTLHEMEKSLPMPVEPVAVAPVDPKLNGHSNGTLNGKHHQ